MYLKYIGRVISNDWHTIQIDIFDKKCRNEESHKHTILYNIMFVYITSMIYVYDICN